jgi:hypothetical protein
MATPLSTLSILPANLSWFLPTLVEGGYRAERRPSSGLVMIHPYKEGIDRYASVVLCEDVLDELITHILDNPSGEMYFYVTEIKRQVRHWIFFKKEVSMKAFILFQ